MYPKMWCPTPVHTYKHKHTSIYTAAWCIDPQRKHTKFYHIRFFLCINMPNMYAWTRYMHLHTASLHEVELYGKVNTVTNNSTIPYHKLTLHHNELQLSSHEHSTREVPSKLRNQIIHRRTTTRRAMICYGGAQVLFADIPYATKPYRSLLQQSTCIPSHN